MVEIQDWGSVMLACDLMVEVRASRCLSADQIARLERAIFAGGNPTRDHLELLFLIDAYLERADPSWGDLLHRAAASALAGPGREAAAAQGRTA
jgi:hypothetical protein